MAEILPGFQVEIPMAVGVCVIYILSSVCLEYYKVTYHKALWMHESSISCLLGILVGYIIRQFFYFTVIFNNSFFFYAVLPPVIFSAGYNLRRKRFFQHIHFIALFGLFGTMLNFVMIAWGAYFFGQVFPDSVYITWNQSLLLSSVLAGSDEVSAMSLIPTEVYPRLGGMIFGEGVINDALSIVLFKTFLPLYDDERHHILESPTAPYVVPLNSVVSSISQQLIFSILIGVSCGLTNAFILKNMSFMQKFPVYQISLVLLFGYLSYSIAEAGGISGILTIFITAITQAHYSWYSLSKAAQVATKLSFSATADIAVGFSFSYVGLSLWAFTGREINYLFSFYIILVVIVARFITICGMFFIASFCFTSFKRVPFCEQLVFVLGGVVRGCLCWAQILQVRGSSLLVTTIMIVVLCTSVGCGTLLPIILPYLVPLVQENDQLVTGSRIATVTEAHHGTAIDPNSAVEQDIQKGNLSGGPVQDPLRVAFNIQRGTSYQSIPTNPPKISIMGDIELMNRHLAAEAPIDIRVPVSAPLDHDEVVRPMVSFSSFLFFQWIRFDEVVMKPLFGGSQTESRRLQLMHETSNLLYRSFVNANEVATVYMRDSKTQRLTSEDEEKAYNDTIGFRAPQSEESSRRYGSHFGQNPSEKVTNLEI